MMTKENIIDFISINKNFLLKEYHINKIGLFGSFVREEEKKDSDIDIIIEFDENVNYIFEIKIKLSELFKKQFNREVDIAREKYLKQRVKDQILRETIYV